jgi:hypothetical protein
VASAIPMAASTALRLVKRRGNLMEIVDAAGLTPSC